MISAVPNTLRSFASFILCFSLFCGTLTAQTSKKDFISELNVKFSSGEDKKLDRGIEVINEAEAMQSRAEKEYENLTSIEIKERISDNYKNALKHLFEASEKYKEGYNTIYEVFKDKADNFWQKMMRNNHRATGMEKAKYYQGTATRTINRSLIRRSQVLQSDRYDYSFNIMKDALNLEKLAIRDQGREMQICADYPVEYNYGWENDLTLEQIVALMKDPIVHEPPADIFATVDQAIVVDSSLFKEIIFKVQIAAHTMPITNEYLNALYKGPLQVDMIFEDDWYKYSIGRYKTFEDAEATRIESNIKKSFVVAYQEGRKISTQEAIRLLERSEAMTK